MVEGSLKQSFKALVCGTRHSVQSTPGFLSSIDIVIRGLRDRSTHSGRVKRPEQPNSHNLVAASKLPEARPSEV